MLTNATLWSLWKSTCHVAVSRRAAHASLVVATLTIVGSTLACSHTPNAEQGRARLVGRYVYADVRRGYGSVINPNFKSASLELRSDGTASQACEFNDGKRYQSHVAKWSYDGDGNVSIAPLKDCSWVYGDRDGPLDVPTVGASLIVEWGNKPVIVMHPDLNAFYQHQ